MAGNYMAKKPDQKLDITIAWWPYASRAATSATLPRPIRVRCTGWSKIKQGVPTFYLEVAESIDPLPLGMSARERNMIIQAVIEELASKLHEKVVLHELAVVDDASEWYAEHGVNTYV